jgi:flagellar biosynthetic protein FliR
MPHAIPVPDLSRYQTLHPMWAYREGAACGLMCWFISYLRFSSIYIAGQLIDMPSVWLVNVFDPISNIQIPITADFYIIFATLFMLVTD